MATKVTFHLQPNRVYPGGAVEVELERVLCNDVTFPWEFSKPTLWVIGNEFGAMGAVWAEHEQDALDELMDQKLAGGLSIDEKDVDEETSRIGNYGTPVDLTHCWMGQVVFDPKRDYKVMCAFAEARGLGAKNLDDGRITLRL